MFFENPSEIVIITIIFIMYPVLLIPGKLDPSALEKKSKPKVAQTVELDLETQKTDDKIISKK